MKEIFNKHIFYIAVRSVVLAFCVIITVVVGYYTAFYFFTKKF